MYWAGGEDRSARVEPLPLGAPLPAGAGANGGRFRGPETARLTLVEFGDYQCPSCAAYHPIVAEFLRRHPNDVRLEFHHLPLISIHPNAMAASLAAEAAGEQGRYWEMHDLLFERQPIWSPSRNAEAEFLILAQRLSLDVNRFMQSMRSPQLQQRVLADVARANAAGVQAVPAFFVDGQPVQLDARVEDFERLLAQRSR